MAMGDNLIYEYDEKGQQHLVRSIESNHRAYIRFTNKTSRPVDISWRNFKGEKIHYARVAPNKFYNVSTFITHPWEFTDASTHERYVVQNKTIYRAPPSVGDMKYVTNWNITVSLRSLRESALLAVALNIKSVDEVNKLQIPRMLKEELNGLVHALLKPPEK